MVCKCCQKVVSDSDRIVCRGFCGEAFHGICVKVDCSLMDVLGLYEKNLYWMCDDCSALFANGPFRSIISCYDKDNAGLPESIKLIQDDISKLNSAVTALTEKVESKQKTPFRFNSNYSSGNNGLLNQNENTPKRRRGENGTTLVGTSKASCGTKVSCTSIKTVKASNELFWIHLSAFHPTTTEDEISELVRDCLQLAEGNKPRVVKLIPKGRDLTTLNFISFKVGVDIGSKTEALSCETWPQDVLFREFVDNGSKNVARIIRTSAETNKDQPVPTTGSSIADSPQQPTGSN